ncbi:MAG: tRNA (adenosine(37)-N6)-dimethylallyltransferase MiaA [Gammaproteobacteria bacterium HGW-Gammaproteobacteria-10]|nr:MAG: tRNA (adenosine(37)-N6)-dimethylallyltransferase MiaA [Gammaproteobacteria bacterium HGW-Gammaproteobacteria-10]
MNEKAKPTAVFLMGPTASGKTSLSVRLAEALDAEIISVDSALVYRGMDIGTAKPTEAERGGIAHHLIDILDPSEAFSTGQFRSRTLELIADISSRGKLPLLTGGTMLYFNALNHGLAQLPTADATVRAELDKELEHIGKEAMHRRLAQVDPDSAARIHPNDPQRVQRALEVYRLTGRTLTELFSEAETQPLPFRAVKLIIAPQDRKLLHEIIAKRFHQMLEKGLVEEVEILYRRGDLSEKMPSIRAVGYRQVWSYLQGEYDHAAMIEKAIVATRQLAKRQFTWLRRETEAQALISGDPKALDRALRYIAESG